MANVNDKLMSLAIRAQIDNSRFANKLVRDIVSLLNDANEDLVAQLIKRHMKVKEGAWTSARLQSLVDALTAMVADGGKVVYEAIQAPLADFAAHEAQGAAAGLRRSLGLDAEELKVTDELLDLGLKSSKASRVRFELDEDAQGVRPGQLRALDRLVSSGDKTTAEIAQGWENVRESIRAQYGDSVVLYRADAPIKERNAKALTAYFGDRDLAKQFTDKDRVAMAYKIPVDDIVALYVRDSGYYEFIVSIPEGGFTPLVDSVPPSLLNVALDVITPNIDQLKILVDNAPIQGALLGELWEQMDAKAALRVAQQIRLGVTEGEGIAAIVRRLTGSARDYEAGIFAIVRRECETLVRTSVNHISNQAIQATYAQNKDIVKSWTFLSTLDGKTSVTCRSLSGSVHKIGEGPIPPRHPNCRSFASPNLATWKELGIDLDELPPSLRASQNGPVRADITMDEWMRGQSKEEVRDMLGATRAKLFWEGAPVTTFADNKGIVYSISDLKERQTAAFARAFA